MSAFVNTFTCVFIKYCSDINYVDTFLIEKSNRFLLHFLSFAVKKKSLNFVVFKVSEAHHFDTAWKTLRYK